MPRFVVVTVLLASLSLMSCGEGPAVSVFVTITKARDNLDTSGITGFLISIGDDEQSVRLNTSAQEKLEFTAPPALDMPFIIYACDLRNAACNADQAKFIGCRDVDLVASDEPVSVVIFIDAKDPLPAACDGFDV